MKTLALLAASMLFAAAPAAAQDILTVTYDGTVSGTSAGSPFDGTTTFTGTADYADANDDGNFAFSNFTASFGGTTYTVLDARGQLLGNVFNVLTGNTLFTSFTFAPGTNFALNTPLAATLGQGGVFTTSPDIGPIQITGGAGIVNSSIAAAVPEPSTWAMMLFGFGAMGVALRRRKRGYTLTQVA